MATISSLVMTVSDVVSMGKQSVRLEEGYLDAGLG
jgi:hypothetical protein